MRDRLSLGGRDGEEGAVGREARRAGAVGGLVVPGARGNGGLVFLWGKEERGRRARARVPYILFQNTTFFSFPPLAVDLWCCCGFFWGGVFLRERVEGRGKWIKTAPQMTLSSPSFHGGIPEKVARQMHRPLVSTQTLTCRFFGCYLFRVGMRALPQSLLTTNHITPHHTRPCGHRFPRPPTTKLQPQSSPGSSCRRSGGRRRTG